MHLPNPDASPTIMTTHSRAREANLLRQCYNLKSPCRRRESDEKLYRHSARWCAQRPQEVTEPAEAVTRATGEAFCEAKGLRLKIRGDFQEYDHFRRYL